MQGPAFFISPKNLLMVFGKALEKRQQEQGCTILDTIDIQGLFQCVIVQGSASLQDPPEPPLLVKPAFAQPAVTSRSPDGASQGNGMSRYNRRGCGGEGSAVLGSELSRKPRVQHGLASPLPRGRRTDAGRRALLSV